MLNRIIITSFLGLFATFSVTAGKTSDIIREKSALLYYVGGYGGYSAISGGYKNDGNVAQGRFTLGAHAMHYKQLTFGAEVGIQSGNNMRISESSALIEPTTDLPLQTNLKPLLDLLFTVKGQIRSYKIFSYIFKGGIAYRQLILEDRTSNYGDTLSKVSGEFQAGFGVNINENISFNAFYQGIYSNNNAGVYIDSYGNTPISHIPTQQAGFLGVEYSFF